MHPSRRTTFTATLTLAGLGAALFPAGPAAAGVPPAWGYAVVREATDEPVNLPRKDRGNSSGQRVLAERTETGSITVTFAGLTYNGGNVLVTPLSSKPRACAVGDWDHDGVNVRVHVECSDRHGVPKDTPVIVSVRSIRAGSDHYAYLFANNPGAAGYIPDTTHNGNGTDPFTHNAVALVEEGLWDARLPDLAATGGHVQVSSKDGTPHRCGVVSWSQDGDDEVVRVRCRDLDGAPANVRWTMLYLKGMGMGGPGQGKATYLFAHRKKAASYQPTFRFTSEGGASTVQRLGKGRYRVTLPNMGKGGAATVTPVGDGSARCNVTSIRRQTLPQRIGVRCWNAAGSPVNARFTLSYLK